MLDYSTVSDDLLYKADHPAALRGIRAPTLVMAGQTDLYFTPADCWAEAEQIPQARYQEIPSLWGHRAGNPYQHPADAACIREAVQQWLSP